MKLEEKVLNLQFQLDHQVNLIYLTHHLESLDVLLINCNELNLYEGNLYITYIQFIYNFYITYV